MDDQNKSAPPASAGAGFAGGSNVNMIQKDQITADFIRQDFSHIAQAFTIEGQEQARKEALEVQEKAREESRKKGYDEGLAAGAQSERGRILAIESVALPGHEDLVAEAKKDGKSTASDLALKPKIF